MKRVAKKKAKKETRKLVGFWVDPSQYKLIGQAAKLKLGRPNIAAWARMTVLDKVTADLLRKEAEKKVEPSGVGTLPSVEH